MTDDKAAVGARHDGVSLTVSDAHDDWFEVSLIPETLAATTLGARTAARIGARLIRPLLVVTSSAMALKLLIDQL